MRWANVKLDQKCQYFGIATWKCVCKKYYVASVYPKVSRQLFLNTDIVKFSMQMTYKFKHLRTKTPASNSCMVISRLLRMECWKIAPKSISKQAYSQAKTSLKSGTANAICWNSLGLFRDYGLNYNFLGIFCFCFSR